MTEPIAVDAPKSRAAVAPLPSLPPLPKLADKPAEPAKAAAPAPTPAATTAPAPAPTPAAATPATPTPAAPAKSGFVKKLTVGAASVLSLAAGIAGVKYFGPGHEAETQDTKQVAAKSTPEQPKAAPRELPKPVADHIPPTPVPLVPALGSPSAPTLPSLPNTPTRPAPLPDPGALAPPSVMPALPSGPGLPPVPSVGPGSAPAVPPTPAFEPPTRPIAYNDPAPLPPPASEPFPRPRATITQVSNNDPAPVIPPAIPVGPSTPPIPVVPATGPASAGPPLPAIPSGPALPAVPPPVPLTGPGGSPPPPIDVAPKLPATPPSVVPPVAPVGGGTPAPKLPLPEPSGDLFPPLPKGPQTPAPTPTPTPAPVTGTPVGGSPAVPVVPPAVPMVPTSPPDFTPAPPTTPVKPPVVLPPEVTPIRNEGNPPAFTRPDPKPTTPPITPITPVTAIERTPTTSYDVDIHEPKSGDTYDSIAREFYNDTRWGAALRAYNQNKPIQGSREVLVPPLYVLKRYLQSPAPTVGMPVSQASGTQEWGSAPPSTTVRSGGEKTFRVPQGGMSMMAIARETLGTEQRWQDIYSLNPQLRSDGKLPAGTDVRLPADARLP